MHGSFWHARNSSAHRQKTQINQYLEAYTKSWSLVLTTQLHCWCLLSFLLFLLQLILPSCCWVKLVCWIYSLVSQWRGTSIIKFLQPLNDFQLIVLNKIVSFLLYVGCSPPWKHFIVAADDRQAQKNPPIDWRCVPTMAEISSESSTRNLLTELIHTWLSINLFVIIVFGFYVDDHISSRITHMY